MNEVVGDLFGKYVGLQARVITTNGDVRQDGKAVMGRGVAHQAALKWPGVRLRLGDLIAGSEVFHLKAYGNHVHMVYYPGTVGPALVSFPVKHHWKDQADLSLIVRSCRELSYLADRERWTYIMLPRPGCGNGGLTWDVVKPIIEPLLDDRFWVVNNDRWQENEKSLEVVKL